MADEKEKPTSKLIWVLVGGGISLIVGVVSALTVNYFTNLRPELTYEITSNEVFPGKANQLGIVAILVRNDGGKEVEDLQCRVEFKDAELSEPRCHGLPPQSVQMSQGPAFVDLSAPFLNPQESFSLQLLIEPNGDMIEMPDIEVRGKGITGTRKSVDQSEALRLNAIAPSFVGILASLFTGLVGLDVFRRRAAGLGTEKKDAVAFLLGLHGFSNLATAIRTSPRNYSWWTLADVVTEDVLSVEAPDATSVEKAIAVLTALQDDGNAIASSSRAIIKTNIARLAIAKGDTDLATNSIDEANELAKRTVESRCRFVPALTQLVDQASIAESG